MESSKKNKSILLDWSKEMSFFNEELFQPRKIISISITENNAIKTKYICCNLKMLNPSIKDNNLSNIFII